MPVPVGISNFKYLISNIKSRFGHWTLDIGHCNLKPSFTLIELLVVMAILSVMASAVILSTDNARDKGKDARRKEDLKALATALVAYRVDNGQYPPKDAAIADLDFSSKNNSASWLPEISTYMPKLVKDPLQAGIITQLASALNNYISNPIGQLASWFTKKIDKTEPQVASDTVLQRTITTAGDDVLGWHDGALPNNIKDMNGAPQGLLIGRICAGNEIDSHYYKPGLRFPNIAIPKNASIVSANLKLTPKNSGNPANWPTNSSNANDMDTRITTDITNSGDSEQFADYDDFIDRLRLSENYSDTNPSHDHHIYNTNTWGTAVESIDVTNLVQNEIYYADWQNGHAINFTWYPQDENQSDPLETPMPPCRGRVFHSVESSAGDTSKMPVLEITWNNDTPYVIACEAEDFSLSNGYVAINPAPFTGSNNGAIWRNDPTHINDLGPSGAGLGTAMKSIYVDTAGTYYFWARTRYPGEVHPPDPSYGDDNSFWLRIDGGSWINVGNESLNDPNFHWVNFANGNSPPISFILSQGLHAVELRVRENHNKIDKIELASNSTYSPSGMGSSNNCPDGPIIKTASLTANGSANNITVESGTSVSIGWTTSNVSSCAINPLGWDLPSEYPIATGSNVTGALTGPTSITYTIDCDGGGATDSITVTVNAPPVIPPPVTGVTGACDNSAAINAYCYRVSQDKRSFILWAQLENTNDPEIFTSPNAQCKDADIDPPAGSQLNFCIKSPPL